jgi:hypothetical protein
MVDVVKTRTDLIERAATELGALTSGETLASEDQNTIDNLVDPLVQQLSIDGVVDIGDTEQIPVEYFLPLSTLLANVAAPSFGQQNNPAVKFEQERILRKLTATKPTYETMTALYF